MQKLQGENPMITLKELLWKNCLQHLDLGENGPYDEMTELEADIIKAVKEWLTQKLQEIANAKTDSPFTRNVEFNLIDELLEEI
jgi:hypothetical protein